MLKATAGAGALAVGVGTLGSASGAITEFDELSVSSDNRIVDESGETFVMRGLGIRDPKRLAVTKHLRGKNAAQIIDLITNTERGWHPRVIRVPASPIDIGEHPNGDTGPEYGPDSPEEIADDRQKMLPPQPVEQDDGNVAAFTQDQLDNYLETYYDPVVEQCKQRGVYCIVDFYRHWHEQPPGNGEGNGGPEGGTEAENHLPYNSEYTNYWAKNTYYGDDGEDVPASWGYVDQRYRNESSDYLDELSDIENGDTPYDKWEVNQNLVDEAVMFWDTVAERYADDPHVIYEPYSKPTAPGIWGPVKGCGAFKQKPLWDVYVDDFATPIMDAIRQYAPEKLLLMSVPGWCQSTQALHWRDFEHDNVAVTWHNAAGNTVSRETNWLNDTDYGDNACNGWEPEESEGLQNAMDIRPVVVTEFGWQDREYTNENDQKYDIPIWCSRCVRPSRGTTDGYGKPLIDALESDDRISWVACWADVRSETEMFGIDFHLPERTLELENGNWYETPSSQIPTNCSDLPCDWKLWDNPNMGKYVKQVLAEKRDAKVPFETMETPTSTPTPDGPTWPEGATDPDGDGKYEDIDGNGRLGSGDVVEAFQNQDNEELQANAKFYDFNDNGRFDLDDIVALFRDL